MASANDHLVLFACGTNVSTSSGGAGKCRALIVIDHAVDATEAAANFVGAGIPRRACGVNR